MTSEQATRLDAFVDQGRGSYFEGLERFGIGKEGRRVVTPFDGINRKTGPSYFTPRTPEEQAKVAAGIAVVKASLSQNSER
jgi:hypothetical protein